MCGIEARSVERAKWGAMMITPIWQRPSGAFSRASQLTFPFFVLLSALSSFLLIVWTASP